VTDPLAPLLSLPGVAESGEVSNPVLAGSLRAAEALGGLVATWQRAPSQALARLHVLAAADLTTEVGRPRVSADVSSRLDMLASLVTGGTSVPAPVVVAVVHGELLGLAPFEVANGVVARAAARLTSISTGLDPKGLGVPEVACLRRSAEYEAASVAFASGSLEGLAQWVLFVCSALEAGAREAKSIADAALTG
jgi:hypothetical protein